MSVLTGIAPDALLDLSPSLWDAMVEASNARWGNAEELAAQQVEGIHALYVATLAAAGAKQLPDPYQVPRPWEEPQKKQKPRQVSFTEFAGMYGTHGGKR